MNLQKKILKRKMVYGILSHKESVVMHNELSIEKGTLENASETLRFIQNV